ncbi:MAG: transketolase C-terminal domain-containing protein [Gemmatimonadales bacterium]
MRYMSGGQVPMSIVFRGPAGAALEQGPALPDLPVDVRPRPRLKVVMPATPADAKGSSRAPSAIPTQWYSRKEAPLQHQGRSAEEQHVVPIGQADIKRPGDHVTLICCSRPSPSASRRHRSSQPPRGIEAEVLDLRTIRPLDLGAIFAPR